MRVSDWNERYLSPDGQHVAELLHEGEVRFGPSYYSLRIDDYVFTERTFGRAGEWSSDSRFFAAEEWESAEHPAITGADTTFLFLVDLRQRLASRAAAVRSGSIAPVVFDEDSVRYVETVYGKHGSQSVTWREVFIPDVEKWFPF